MIFFELSTYPSKWNSAHQPVPFVFDFESRTLNNVINAVGKASFRMLDFTYQSPAIGERLYIDSGVYAGYHTITGTGTGFGGFSTFSTTTDYISNDSGVNVKAVIAIPEFTLYKGYESSEAYEVELPFEVVATFTPVVSPEVDIRFDVSGFLKSIFTIQAPTIGIDFSLFNRFRIRYDGHGTGSGGGFVVDDTFQVLNSSIPTAELMSVYFGTGVYLSSSITQIIFGCGKTILSLLDATGVVINTDVDDGDTGADYYYDDYNDDDYLTQISN